MSPEISIIIPTTGSLPRIERCIDSLVNHSADTFLKRIELVIFLNTRSKSSDLKTSQYLSDRYSEKIPNLQIKFSENYLWTAEESAFEACQFATKEYLWIVGDQRIFLPEGLEELDRILINQNPEGIFFNNIWVDAQGINLGKQSLSMDLVTNHIRYKDFVIMTGYNYMPTNFGSWIVKNKYLKREIWKEVVANSGWHFSHVATYLITMSEKEIIVNSTFLIQMELKDYHLGDSTGWEEYARKQQKIRFSPWVETLPMQLSYLIKEKIISYHDLRVAVINEGDTFKRLIDELYQFAILQMKLSKDINRERLPEKSFLVIRNLLRFSSPERVHANVLLDQLYYDEHLSKRDFKRIQTNIENIISQDYPGGKHPLVSLIIGSISNFWIRLHPTGFIISPKNDLTFMESYKVLNKRENQFTNWMFCEDTKQLDERAALLNSNFSSREDLK